MKSFFVALLALLCTLPAFAATTVYKKVMPDGTVVFSDEPMENSETLQVEPVPTIPAYRPLPSEPASRPQPVRTSYESIRIIKPDADEHFVNNVGQVTIEAELKPALGSGHELVLKLNGDRRAGPTTSNSFSFSNLDRGAYTAIVEIVDKQGKVVKASQPVTFHVQRARIRQSP